MADQAGHMNVFQANHSDLVPDDYPKVLKRNRRPVSCTPCRTRKLRCNRMNPCETCLRRGIAERCDLPRTNELTRVSKVDNAKSAEQRERLDRLERIITSLANAECGEETSAIKVTRGESQPQTYQDGIDRSPDPGNGTIPAGSFNNTGGNSTYSGATHWVTIINEINELREVLDLVPLDDKDKSSDTPNSRLLEDGTSFMNSHTTPSTSFQEILTIMPPRETVDRLLSVYFNAKWIYAPFIHQSKFQREYERFWQDPSSASFSWVSLVLSALCIGDLMSYGESQIPSSTSSTANWLLYMNLARRCLSVDEWGSGNPYAVEALILYSQCKQIRSEELDPDTFSIMCQTTRLAQMMGYHRDPRHLGPKISAFEGEMRRRTFVWVETFDLHMSFQLGMPPIINEEECDVDAPGNLFDDDFDETCDALPGHRPETDPTPMLYFSFKSGMIRAFRRVVRSALTTRPATYETTLSLDTMLEQLHGKVPPSLKYKPIRSSFMDDSNLIFNRVNLELLYLKSKCVLHRPYLNQHRDDAKYDYSRKACTEAALQILQIQSETDVPSQAGGQLYQGRRMFTALSFHDFMLAAVIVCLDLSMSKTSASSTATHESSWSRKREALTQSRIYWRRRSPHSKVATRALIILDIMLEKTTICSPSTASTQETIGSIRTSPYGGSDGDISDALRSERGISTNPDVALSSSEPMLDGYLQNHDALGMWLNEPLDLDWPQIDHYLLDPGIAPGSNVEWEASVSG